MAKAVFLTGTITIASIEYPLVALKWTKSGRLVDTTDLSGDSGTTDGEVVLIDQIFQAEMWKDVGQANLSIASGQSVDMDFEGFEVSGTCTITSVSKDAIFDSAIKIIVTGILTGAVSEVVAP